MTGKDREIARLQAANLSLNARVRELEEALARCVAKGIRLSEVLKHYNDAPGPRAKS
jgi:hypothetical protein